MNNLRVTFYPIKKAVSVPNGITIREAAILAGIIIDAPCGGNGKCGKCKVEILDNVPPPTDTDKKFLSELEIQKGIRLACTTQIYKNTTVVIPKKVQLDRKKIMISGQKRKVDVDPEISKTYIEIEPQTLENQVSDEELLRSVIGNKNVSIGMDCMREIPGTLRGSIDSDRLYKITNVLSNTELIAVEPGNTETKIYGIAIDIGTTSVVGLLLDLHTGKTLHVVSELNTQSQFGADVISRILYVINNKNGLEKLQYEIIDVINRIIEELCAFTEINYRNIYLMSVVGNTTMQHLFLGVNPQFLAVSPYICGFKNSASLKARELGINIHPRGNIFIFPNIAGFVGGDTLSVALALNMHKNDEIKLAIDIGTNGELILGNKDKLLTASCAAGPAFEGAQISSGMRAVPGAIESVFISNEGIFWRVIGHVAAQGICGSGLIDITAELLKYSVIEETGRIRSKNELQGKIPAILLNSIIENPEKDGNSFTVAEIKDKKICITQKDIRELQLAKGAIHAGIELLIKEMNISYDDISEIYIAGTFGNYIDKTNAKLIGLIPDYPLEKVKFVGNAAAEGARLLLISQPEKEELQKILDITRYMEISGRPDFQDQFAESLMFPAYKHP